MEPLFYLYLALQLSGVGGALPARERLVALGSEEAPSTSVSFQACKNGLFP